MQDNSASTKNIFDALDGDGNTPIAEEFVFGEEPKDEGTVFSFGEAPKEEKKTPEKTEDIAPEFSVPEKFKIDEKLYAQIISDLEERNGGKTNDTEFKA